jgi:hypothetical protein
MVSNYYMPKQTPKVTAEHHGLRLVIAAADHPTDPVVYGSA